jgi:tetratricopeptide (TPR) repeat protein
MNIKITLLVMLLLTSIFPLSSSALWGKKKINARQTPTNAYSILLSTNNHANITENQTVQTEAETAKLIDKNEKKQQKQKLKKMAPEQFKIAHNLLTNADTARNKKDFVSALALYDKAINAYIKIENEYPDWQPAVIKFHRNHCTYHLKELLRQADQGKIKLHTGRKPANPRSSKKEKATALTEARQLLMQNKNEEARDLLIKTLMADPDNKKTRLMIAIVQCRLQQYDDAAYLLETLTDEYPDDANARVILATAYFALNRNQDSISQLNKALKINPFHKEANFNMARVLLETTPKDTESIAKYYIKAVELGATRDAKLDAAILQAPMPSE